MASRLDALVAGLLRNRRFVRAPIWLYQHGFGRLLGKRVIMLEHRGRKSGLPRFVCLEVVERPTPDTIVIVSGFGQRAQWYRNLRADPECYLSSGRRRRVPAYARLMPDRESADALARYKQRNPRAWRRLRGAIEHAVGRSVDGLPMVELSTEKRETGAPGKRAP
jgi:deazaflavin-dependent oxidoreductase (nitroreductase family)